MSRDALGETPSELLVAARDLLGADIRPLPGGYSGETFLVGAAGEEVVLRLYGREPQRAGIDAALLRLVRGLVPVPRVLDVRTTSTPEAPAYLVTERLSGERLDVVLADGSVAVRQRVAEELGTALARLSGVPFLRGGSFADDQLTVAPWPAAQAGLEEWVESHRNRDAFTAWPAAAFERLRRVARRAQARLDLYTTRICLVHGDLNPKNVLVEPDSGAVTGLVDWEFAHAGTPYTDLGNLLRFESDASFCRAVVDAFSALAPGIAADHCVELARSADMFALIDLAARADRNPVAAAAHRLLWMIAESEEVAGGRGSG